MSKPKISIIIPVYNAEKTIGNILKKLISQSYKNIEIITINDGSVDNSWKIIQSFANKNKRIISVNQENRGASAARNAGIELSNGKYITFIDSDDDIDSELINVLASRITDNSDFIMCCMRINGNDVTSADIQIEGNEAIVKYVLQSLLKKNLLYGPYCKLFRRSIIVDMKLQFPDKVKYGEDTIFVLNYLRHTEGMSISHQVLYTYKLQSSGLASVNSKDLGSRKARNIALRLFMRNNWLSIQNVVAYIAIRCRWGLSYCKAIYVRKRNEQ
jgi:glycosyltransferase involved in cell wall biosynthesis